MTLDELTKKGTEIAGEIEKYLIQLDEKMSELQAELKQVSLMRDQFKDIIN